MSDKILPYFSFYASLTPAEALEFYNRLQAYFDEVGWDDDPLDSLTEVLPSSTETP